MKKYCIVLFLFAALSAASSSVVSAQSESNIAGFVSGTGGAFNLTFPDAGPAGQAIGENVGFEDVYGSKSGFSYGGEVGLGLGDIGIFGVAKYRAWKKSGKPVMLAGASFNGEAEWSQNFFSAGLRYFLVKQTQESKTLLPFVGGGVIYCKGTESMKGEVTYMGESEYADAEVQFDGTGFYVEGGTDLYVAPNVSLRGIVEYSSLKLSASAVRLGGNTYAAEGEINGGGGIFAGVSLSMFFGKPMKKF